MHEINSYVYLTVAIFSFSVKLNSVDKRAYKVGTGVSEGRLTPVGVGEGETVGSGASVGVAEGSGVLVGVGLSLGAGVLLGVGVGHASGSVPLMKYSSPSTGNGETEGVTEGAADGVGVVQRPTFTTPGG
jgi:hypothetical protein